MRGTTVILFEKRFAGFDALNNPTFTAEPVPVADVLVGEPSTDEVLSSTSLFGKKLEYMLGLPKGDTHDWTNTRVEIFGKEFETFGDVIEGIEANVPTRWHKKVRVARVG